MSGPEWVILSSAIVSLLALGASIGVLLERYGHR